MSFHQKKQEEDENKILIDFLKLSLSRSVLFTNNFSEETEEGKDIEYLENMEWRILESKEDCTAISDLTPISVLYLNEQLLSFFNFDKKFMNKSIYFLPLKSNQWVVISNDNDLINTFEKKSLDTDFKTILFNIIFAKIFMFSLQYVVVANNNWIINVILDLISIDEIRNDIINKRKHEYKLIGFFNTIHNLKNK